MIEALRRHIFRARDSLVAAVEPDSRSCRSMSGGREPIEAGPGARRARRPRFEGAIAVVSGAAGGIGFAVARRSPRRAPAWLPWT